MSRANFKFSTRSQSNLSLFASLFNTIKYKALCNDAKPVINSRFLPTSQSLPMKSHQPDKETPTVEVYH
jgi:hypothetical protein